MSRINSSSWAEMVFCCAQICASKLKNCSASVSVAITALMVGGVLRLVGLLGRGDVGQQRTGTALAVGPPGDLLGDHASLPFSMRRIAIRISASTAAKLVGSIAPHTRRPR